MARKLKALLALAGAMALACTSTVIAGLSTCLDTLKGSVDTGTVSAPRPVQHG